MGSSDSFRFNLTIPLFMDVFFVAVFLFLSGCHILIEKSAIFITKMQFLSLEDITLQFLKKQERRKKNYSKQQKCYTTSLRILSPKTERIFCRLVLISVSNPQLKLVCY